MPAFDPVLNVSDLNGTNGFRIDGAPYDSLGWSVSGAGDVNGDGFDDLILGTHAGSGGILGVSYVVFGSSGGFPTTLSVTDLDGSNGFKIEGDVVPPGGGVEMSVSDAGDVNGDGIGDLIIGVPHEDPNGAELRLELCRVRHDVRVLRTFFPYSSRRNERIPN